MIYPKAFAVVLPFHSPPPPRKKFTWESSWKLKIDSTLLALTNPPASLLSPPLPLRYFHLRVLRAERKQRLWICSLVILLIPPTVSCSLPLSFWKVLATLLHSLIHWLTCSLRLSLSLHTRWLCQQKIHWFACPSIHPTIHEAPSLFFSFPSFFCSSGLTVCHLFFQSLDEFLEFHWYEKDVVNGNKPSQLNFRSFSHNAGFIPVFQPQFDCRFFSSEDA